MLNKLLELQILGGFATRFTEFALYKAEFAVKLKIKSTFDVVASPIFCVGCSFMVSLSNAFASPREDSEILYLGCLAEDSAPSIASCSLSNSTSLPSFKIFPHVKETHLANL